jgi:O-antigen/teichoic acid export membrane protein
MINFTPRLKNLLTLSGIKLVQPLFSFFLIRAISNDLGVKYQGIYTTVFGFLLLFEVVSSFGLRTLLIREVAQHKSDAKRYFIHSLYIAIPAASFCVLLMNIIVTSAGYNQAVVTGVLLVSLSLIATAFNDCAEGILIGFERIQFIGGIQLVCNVIKVVVSLLLIHFGFGINSVLLMYFLYKAGISAGYAAALKNRLRKDKVYFNKIFLYQMLKDSRIFALIVIFVTLYWKADILMLSAIKGDEAVGVYDGAYRFFSIIVIIISNAMVSLFPVISEKFQLGPDTFEFISKKILKYFLIAVLPGVSALILLSRFLILTLFNSVMTNSVSVLYILAIGLIPYGVTEILAYILIASGNQVTDMKINGLGVICNIALNAVLIPKWSYLGAAAATLISIHCYLLLQLFFVYRLRQFHIGDNKTSILLKFSASAAVLGTGVVMTLQFSNAFFAAAGYAGYFFVVFFLQLISKEDKKIIFSMIKGIRGSVV